MRLPKLAKEFCSHFFEKTISTYDKHMGEIETISVKDQSIRWYMSLSADFADQTLLEALPLSVAYMLGDFYDGALGSYAFNVYCAEFSRFSAGAGLNTQHLLGVCGEYAHQLPSILNTLTELRSGDDDYETIAEAVGILREAIAGIVGDATSSH